MPLSKQMAVEGVAGRAEGYGMPGLVIDGADVTAAYEATSEAAARARAGEGPTLIEAMVERYLPHTSDDDDTRYRDRKDIEEARKQDPLKILREHPATLDSLSDGLDAQIHADAKREIDEATEFAEAAPYPPAADFHDHVYAPLPDEPGIGPGGASSP